MSVFLRCPQGHQWKVSANEATLGPAQSASCPTCGAPSEPPPVTHPWDADASTLPPEWQPVVGSKEPTLAGYEILCELGRGGMGVVYKARQVKLQRLVALKMILAGSHAGPKQLARFRAEAEAVARLQHPNIVHIYEVGDQNGLAFYSLELVDGGSLAQKLTGNPRPFRESADLIRILAGTMNHAHQRGIIHRDLKPANILLTTEGVPKITDFGLAKQLSTGSDGSAGPASGAHTQTGAVIGTPSYMAPEQAGAKSEEVGPAADIYALGAILYEMLTGRPPFRAETPLDTVLQVISEEPVPPRRLSPRVPRDLETICLKCLEKEPRRRYRSAQDLADELARFLKDEPIRAHPISASARMWRWCKRNPMLAATSSMAVAALLAAFFVSVFLSITKTAHATRLQQVLEKSDRLLVDLSFERAKSLCEDGDVGRGLLWFAHTLKTCPQDAFDWQWTLRANLAAWRLQWRSLRDLMPQDAPVTAVAFGESGRTLITFGAGHKLVVWNAATGLKIAESPPDEAVYSPLVVSPDGKLALTTGRENEACLWDLPGDGATAPDTPSAVLQPRRLRHSSPVRTAAFATDGKIVLTGCQDGTVRGWNTSNAEQVGPTLPHGGAVHAMAFDLESKGVWTGGADYKVRRWDPITGVATLVLEHAAAVEKVALSPDGTILLTLTEGDGVQLWKAATGKRIGQLPHRYRVHAIAFSADGATLATGGEDHAVQCWRTATAEPIGKPLQQQDLVHAIAFDPGGRVVLIGGSDRTARFWDVATGMALGSPLEHQGAVLSVAFSPDGRSVLTGGSDQVLRLWESSLPEQTKQVLQHPDQVMSVAFSPDGKTAVTGCGDHNARLWDLRQGKPFGALLSHADEVWPVAFSPDGQAVLTGSKDGTARLWDASTGKPIGSPLRVGHWVRAVAFSPDGQRILTGSGDQNAGTAQLWDRATGTPLGPPLEQTGAVWAVAFSPDGTTAVTGHGEDQAQLWDLGTGKPLGPALQEQARVVAAAFSPDGKFLITGSPDRTVRLWTTDTGRSVGEPLRHRSGVWDVAFGPDGKTIVIGGQDGTVRLWNIITGKPLGAVLAHDGAVLATTFSPDGHSILTGSADRTARLRIVPSPLQGAPQQILLWTEVITGMELEPTGEIHVLDARAWREKKELLDELGGPPP